MASAAATDLSGFSIVPTERLRALEALEAELPAIIEKAKEEAHKERFAALRARDAVDPEAHRRRTAEWREKNKDAYNAKRREQYRQKKEQEAQLAAAGHESPGMSSAAARDH